MSPERHVTPVGWKGLLQGKCGGTVESEAPVRAVTPKAIQAQLRPVLASQAFSRAGRSGRLLSFLVEQVLHGEADKIDEYLLAMSVFARQPSFDPNIDSIVRVEAGRLRRRLRAYYEGEGREDPILIELPPRTYVPVFQQRPAPAGGAVTQAAPAGWLSVGRLAVAAAALLFAGTVIYWGIAAVGKVHSAAAAPSPALSPQGLAIAVLPFANLSGDLEEEHFCDGLTAEVVETLTKLDGLRVVSRRSASQFKDKTGDIRRIAEQLNAGLVLEGSVRRQGRTLRVTAELVNAADGYHLWSQAFEREKGHAFTIQQDIARGIAGTLRSRLGRERWLRPLEEHPPGPEAYSLYLRGLHFENLWSSEGLAKAIEHFGQAVRTDPKYAVAYAKLAECYAIVAARGEDPTAMRKAQAAAQKALELDPTLSHAHAALGLVKGLHDWDWAGAEREFQRMLELDPTDARLREEYVMGYLAPLSRLDEALRAIQKAHELDPTCPRVHSALGMVYYFRRQYDYAITEHRHALELGSEFRPAYLGLGLAYEQKSMFADAISVANKAAGAAEAEMTRAFLGHTYARMGRKAEALALAGELVGGARQRRVSPMDVAALYTGLGDKERAFEWLEKGYAERSPSLVYLKVNPRFDDLRADPRFTDLLRRIHLE